MIYEYRKEHEITYSETDLDLKLSIPASMDLNQDITTKYFQTFKCDNNTTRINDNAVWVIVKAKVHYNKRPTWIEKMKIYSHIVESKVARVRIETVFYDKNDEVLFTVTEETCPIDVTTRKVRKLDTISYPKDMEVTETIENVSFSRLKTEFGKEDLAYTQKIQATDIDYSNHANNVVYVRYIMNAFKTDYWKDKEITNFEIYFLNESRENESLSVYKKEINKGTIELLIGSGEKEIIRAKIEYT